MARCPPGVFCLSEGTGTLIMILFIGSLLFLTFMIVYGKSSSVITMMPTTSPSPKQTVIVKGGDSRYEQAPQPLQSWAVGPEFPPRGGLSTLPFNIPTQGLPDSFQSVGVINVGEQVLPLYGRRTTGGGDRWNYYTRTDTYNPVPVPVHFQRRDCMDGVGCSEVMSGETVKIDALHKEGKTHLYKMDGPKYIPGML
jgi:hypothetical protein